MTIWSRIFNAPKQPAKAPAPNVSARVSTDEGSTLADAFRGYMGDLNWLAAKYPFEWLGVIDQVYRFDPTAKKHALTTIALGNPGHDLEIDAGTEQRAQAALGVCNDLAGRCFPFAGGMDGLMNGLFYQCARSGGLCCEWVPDEGLKQISRAYLVPVRTIRFRKVQDGSLEIGQVQDGRFTALNPVQTSYHAVWTEDSNPYPTPPVLAVIERLTSHKRIMTSIETWFQKLAAMGFLSLIFDRPEAVIGETPEQYRARCRTHLESLTDTVKANLTSGIVLGFDDMKAQFNNTSAGAGGAKQVAQMIDEDLFSGLGRDPVMFGRSFSRTETWSRVAFEELSAEIGNTQLGPKRAVEHGHRLNLALNGFGDVGVSLHFKPTASLDEIRDANARSLDDNRIIGRFTAGLIDYDEARELLGMEDRKAKSGTFTASFANGRYVMRPYERTQWTGITYDLGWIPDQRQGDNDHRGTPPCLSLEGRAQGYAPTHRNDAVYDPRIGVVFNEGGPVGDAARRYLAEIREMLSEAGRIGVDAVYDWAMLHDVPDVDSFVALALREFLEAAEGSINERKLIEIASTHIEEVWKGGRVDPKLWGPALPKGIGIGVDLDIPDRKAISYMTNVDRMYVSTYVSHSPQRSKQIQSWMQNQYLEKGLGIGKTPKQLDKFREEFGVVSEKLGDHAARVIIDTGVQRSRNWSSIMTLHEQGYSEFRIGGPVDNLCCRYCAAMVGRTFSVQQDYDRIMDIVESGEEDISKFDPFLTSRYGTKAGIAALKSSKDEDVQRSGIVTPPFHPLCRHYIQAVVV